jgi:hypothetical protein
MSSSFESGNVGLPVSREVAEHENDVLIDRSNWGALVTDFVEAYKQSHDPEDLVAACRASVLDERQHFRQEIAEFEFKLEL